MRIVLDEGGIATVKEQVKKGRIDFAADLKSLAEDLTPIGVTSDLLSAWEQYDDDEVSRVYNNDFKAVWNEMGTEPFKAKLIEVSLSKRAQGMIRKAGHKVRIGKNGGVLVPIWFERWGPKVSHSPPRDTYSKVPWNKIVDNYVNSWGLWFKIAKKGIKAKHFLHRATTAMNRREPMFYAIDRHLNVGGNKIVRGSTAQRRRGYK